MIFFKLKVVEIKQEIPDTVTLCLKQPGLKKIPYLPGQYLTLVFRINGRKYARPYSFSSAPGVDQHLEVTIKRVPGGIVSNHINDCVKVDDMVEVIEPMGDFVFNPEQLGPEKHIVLWGAGSGITPLISIAKYVLHKQTGNDVCLVYGNKNFETVIFKDKIAALQNTFAGKFTTFHFHTQLKISAANPDVIEGRISPKTVLSVLQKQVDLKNTVHYICGPTGLKQSVKDVLQSLAVSEEAIFTEDFEVVKNPADFEEIHTQMIEIVKNGQPVAVEVVKGRSILEAGLDSLIDLDYSCQTGSCKLCKAKILSGKIKTIGADSFAHEIGENECLMCCGYPLTNDVKLSVY